MKIQQIRNAVTCGKKNEGKWYCSDFRNGPNGEPIIRYLQHDGTWEKNTAYFDSEDQITEALEEGHEPDFTLSRQEMEDRAMMRQDIERDFEPIFPGDCGEEEVW